MLARSEIGFPYQLVYTIVSIFFSFNSQDPTGLESCHNTLKVTLGATNIPKGAHTTSAYSAQRKRRLGGTISSKYNSTPCCFPLNLGSYGPFKYSHPPFPMLSQAPI